MYFSSKVFMLIAFVVSMTAYPMENVQADDAWEFRVGAEQQVLSLNGETGATLEEAGLESGYSSTALMLAAHRREVFGSVGLGAELTYAQNGDSAARTECVTSLCARELREDVEFDFDIAELWLVAKMPLDENTEGGWSVLGKTGVNHIAYDIERSVTTDTGRRLEHEKESGSASTLAWGIGAEYRPHGTNFSFQFGYSADQDSQLEQVSLQLSYGF